MNRVSMYGMGRVPAQMRERAKPTQKQRYVVKSKLLQLQGILIYATMAIVVAIFIVYLGFMTRYYVLFFDGTFEMFEYYKQLQVFNKEAFGIALYFIVVIGVLSAFKLNRYRPGLAGLTVVIGATVFYILRSLALLNVLPKYKRGYLALDFAQLDEYTPSTFVFDAGMTLHYLLIVVSVLLTVVSLLTFVQRLKEGKPLIRRLT